MDSLVQNGIIVDGTGGRPYYGDIRLSQGRITAIGKKITPKSGQRVIDAAGDWVAPGFIDCHTHSDLAVMLDGGLDCKTLQGVTTEVTGQCGLSVFPLPEERRAAWRATSVIGNPAFDWGWESAREWLTALASRPLATNVMPFIGAGTLRYGLVGDDPRPLDANMLCRYREELEKGFEAGIAGLSFGLIYLPAIFSTGAELELAAQTAARYGRPLAVHLRSESDELELAVKEMIDLAERTGVHLHLSHLKAIGLVNAVQLKKVLSLIERYGLEFDHYPYTWGSTSLLSLVPPYLAREGVSALLQGLGDPALQDQLADVWEGRALAAQGTPWDNLPALLGWDKIRIISAANAAAEDCLGLTLDEAAKKRGISPTLLVCQVLQESKGDARMTDEYMEEDLLVRILRHPAGCIASDSLFGAGAHPRVSGCFPRVIERYVLGQGLLSIETAVRKMTAAPAEWLGIPDRGRISQGMCADLVVFGRDIAESQDGATPKGIRAVFVNGGLVASHGRISGEACTGQVLLSH